MLSNYKHGTTNVIIREKWNGTNIEQNGTFKIPHFRNMVLSLTYYPIASFKAEIWHKVEESVPKQSGSIALHKSFSQAKYSTQFCLFVLANQMQACKTQILATFGTCYSSQMPSSRLKCGKKLRNTSPSRFVSTALHKSLLQAKYVEYCM